MACLTANRGLDRVDRFAEINKTLSARSMLLFVYKHATKGETTNGSWT